MEYNGGKLMAQPKLTAEDKKWRAERDARTLIEASIVEADPTRKKLAAGEMKKIAEETKEKAKAIGKAATRVGRSLKKGKTTRKSKK